MKRTGKMDKHNQNDFRRFIKKTAVTDNGEFAQHKVYTINQDAIEKESMYDGFYAVYTNLGDDRIKAHFTTCFIALLIYRILEKKLDSRFTCDEIATTLRTMQITEIGTEGYTPSYTRTELTDALHDYAGFRTDYELISKRTMKGICRCSKE